MYRKIPLVAVIIVLVFLATVLPVTASLSLTRQFIIIEGRLEALTIDYFNFEGKLSKFVKGTMKYYLVLDDGKRIALEIPENLRPSFLYVGKRIRVSAIKIGENSYNVIEKLQLITRKSKAAKTIAKLSPVLGPQKTWVLLVKFSDIPNEPMAPDEINSVIFERELDDGGNLRDLIIDNSFGKASVIGDTIGWYPIDSSDHYNPSDPGNLCDASIESVIEALIDALENLYMYYGIQVSDHDRIILFFNVDTATFGYCAFAFLGYIKISLSYGDRIVSAQYMPTDSWGTNLGVIAHEYGHQMGLPHTSHLSGPYDSPWDIMSHVSGRMSFMAESRRLLGWLDDDSIITVKSRSGAATLTHLAGGSSRLQGIKEFIIEDLEDSFWTFEDRLKDAYDTDLPNEGLIAHYCDLTRDDWICDLIDSTPGDNVADNAQFDLGEIISEASPRTSKQISCEIIGEIESAISYRITCSRSWINLGGKTDSSPTLINDKAYVSPGEYTIPKAYVYVKGMNDCGYKRYMDPQTGDFKPWESAGICNIPESPVATIADSHIILVQRSAQNKLYVSGIDIVKGIQYGWSEIGGLTPSRPALAADNKPRLTAHLVVRGMNNEIYHRRIFFAPESNWQTLGGKTLMSPAVYASDGKLHVAVVGLDERIYYKRLYIETGIWTPWECLGGKTDKPPAIISNEDYVLIVVKGLDNKLYAKIFSIDANYWYDWISLGGSTTEQPILTGFKKAGLSVWYLIVKGGGNTIWYKYTIDGGFHWSNWIKVKGITPSIPAADVDPNLNLQISVRGANDAIYFTDIA